MKRRRSWETVYVTIQPLITNLVGVPAMAFIVRQQGATNYGYWLTAMAIVQTVGIMSSLGLRPIFVRTLAQNPGEASVRVGEQLTLRMLLATFAGLIAVAACLALRHPPLVLACVLIAALGLVVTGASECLIDTLHAFEHFTGYANVFLLSGMSLTAASVIVCALGGGPIALSLSYLVGPLINAIGMGTIVMRREFRFRPQWNVERFRTLWRESRMVGRSMLLSSLQERLEQLLLPKMVSPADFGYFAAGLIPSSRLNVIPSGLTTVFYPRIARTCKAGAEAAAPIVRSLMLAMLVICLPTTLGVVLFGPWIAHILFPTQPELCAWIIHITMWSLPIVATNWALSSALQASGHHDRQARANITASILGFVVGALIVLRFGLIGACVSWLLRPSIVFVLLARPFVQVFPGLLRRFPFVRLGLATAAMHGTISLGSHLLDGSPLALCGIGLVASVVFMASLVLLRVITLATIKGLASGAHGASAPPEPANKPVAATPT